MQSVVFAKQNRVGGSSVGMLLRYRRESFALTLEEIEAATTIGKKNIAALEDDQFERIPEELYRECFLKKYSTYLGFEWEEVRAAYRVQTALYHPSLETAEKSAPVRAVRAAHLVVQSRMIKNGGITAVIALCGVYLAWLGYGMISPPPLVITAPANNISVHDGSVVVAGRTEADATITINGLPVSKDKSGAFTQDVALAEGLNTVMIVATKKYSSPSQVTRSIVFRRGGVSMN